MTDAEAIAADMLGSRVTGFPSVYDDDAKQEEVIEVVPEKDDSEDIENILISEEFLVELDASYDNIFCTQNTPTENDAACFSGSTKHKQWGGQTVPLLRTKISTPLKHPTESTNVNRKRKMLQDNLSNWAGGKAALNELQEKFMREEHELNQNVKIEEHNCKIKRDERLSELHEEEAKLRIECLKEELAIKKLQKVKLLQDELCK